MNGRRGARESTSFSCVFEPEHGIDCLQKRHAYMERAYPYILLTDTDRDVDILSRPLSRCRLWHGLCI